MQFGPGLTNELLNEFNRAYGLRENKVELNKDEFKSFPNLAAGPALRVCACCKTETRYREL